MSDFLQIILNHYPNIRPDPRGEYHVPCPSCGKEPKRGHTHFSFSVRGYKCMVCGSHGGLYALSQHLGIESRVLVRSQGEKPKPIPIPWRVTPEPTLQSVLDGSERFEQWPRYKPLSATTIERYQFGYGRLPFRSKDGRWYMSRQPWLVVPLFECGQLVGLRGRNLTDQGPKWISATGSAYTLWNVDGVRRGDTVWLCENYVDAAWLMQAHPEWRAVAIGGATTWRERWGEMLAERQPAQVIVALDNDLAGQATGQMYNHLRRQWEMEHPALNVPEPNGPKIANNLLGLGLRTILFRWPADAPAKAGIDWVLGKECSQKLKS